MKAFLVIDVPEEDIGKAVSYISLKEDEYFTIRSGEGLKLRRLPSKIDVGMLDYENRMLAEGWNACVEGLNEKHSYYGKDR